MKYAIYTTDGLDIIISMANATGIAVTDGLLKDIIMGKEYVEGSKIFVTRDENLARTVADTSGWSVLPIEEQYLPWESIISFLKGL